MSVPRDLRITLRYLTAQEASRQGIQAAQPGFYVEASNNEGYGTILRPTRIDSFPRVQRIAREIDAVLELSERAPIEQAVANVRSQHQRDAIDRRRAAEKAIEQAKATLAVLDAEAEV
jgi:hypothetical protein